MDRLMHASSLLTAGRTLSLGLACMAMTESTWAAKPAVQFDVPPVVACRDKSDAAFLAAHPGERLIEVRFTLSALVLEGSGNDLQEYFVRVTSPNHSFQVVDYEPRTKLASDYAGNIAVEKKDETTTSAGLSVNGVWEPLVRLSGAADRGSKSSEAVRYELHAPQEAVLASGTILRGEGVYFKLRPSRQDVLEGSHEFSLTLRVPSSWRGDYMQVHCQAAAIERGLTRSFDETVVAGRRDFFVALYLAGDAQAKQAAEQMTDAELIFQKVLGEYRQQLTASPRRSVVAQFVGLLDQRARPKGTPRQQIEEAVFSHHARAKDALTTDVPREVRLALESYLDARLTVRALTR